MVSSATALFAWWAVASLSSGATSTALAWDYYPPCIDVNLEAAVTGRPPLEVEWQLPDGAILAGESVTIDTSRFARGLNTIRLVVRNDAGQAEQFVYVGVESLAWSGPASWTSLGDRTVEVSAPVTGASEWRWTWGDGTSTSWQPCSGTLRHQYPIDGVFAVGVEARSCNDGPISQTITVVVETVPPPTIVRWETACSSWGGCEVRPGEAVPFVLEVSGGAPESYVYDWDGDGLADLVSQGPVFEHVYQVAGLYWPRVTVLRGLLLDQAQTPLPVFVSGDPVDGGKIVLFEDGFESGSSSRWSRVVE